VGVVIDADLRMPRRGGTWVVPLAARSAPAVARRPVGWVCEFRRQRRSHPVDVERRVYPVSIERHRYPDAAAHRATGTGPDAAHDAGGVG